MLNYLKRFILKEKESSRHSGVTAINPNPQEVEAGGS
jgi:hypothetical protein